MDQLTTLATTNPYMAPAKPVSPVVSSPTPLGQSTISNPQSPEVMAANTYPPVTPPAKTNTAPTSTVTPKSTPTATPPPNTTPTAQQIADAKAGQANAQATFNANQAAGKDINGNPIQTTSPGTTTTPPPNSSPTTPPTAPTQDQIDSYNQDPVAFLGWAKSNNWTDVQIANLKTEVANDKLNSDAKTYNDKLTQLANGTYPLTASQQASLDALQKQWDLTVQAQRDANSTYTNAAGMLAARSGRSEYNPQNVMGAVQQAIDTGINQVARYQAAGTEAVNNMRQGFIDSNFKQVTEAYNAIIANDKAITDEMNKIYDNATAAQKDARDYSYKVTQDAITNTLNSDKFTYQQKDDAIKNALENSKLDETKRSNLADEAIKMQANALQHQANDILAHNNQVPTLPSGTPDPVAQEKYLSQFSPDVQNLIKGVADYTLSISDTPQKNYKGAGGLTQQQLASLVKGYDPSFDQNNYAARASFLKNWKAGGTNSVIVAANTGVQHLGTLKTSMDILAKQGNLSKSGVFGTSKYNDFKTWIEANKGNPTVSQVNQDMRLIATEIAKIYKNGSNSNAAPSPDEIDGALKDMTAGYTPDNVDGIIVNSLNLLGSKMNTSRENYQMVMGKSPDNILFPTTTTIVKNLMSKMSPELQNQMSGEIFDPNKYSDTSNDDLINSITGNTSTNSSGGDFWSGLTTNSYSQP